MIQVTRLNNEHCIINSDLIELIESTPDTLLTLTTGRKLMVRETSDEIVERIVAFRSQAGIKLAYPGMLASGSRLKTEDDDDDEPATPSKGFLRFDTR